MSLAILFHFLCAQHVSDINISIIRSYSNPATPNLQHTTNWEQKTDVVIQQHSHKLLMMDILMSETCWAHTKWNKIASDIKLDFYSSTITMMHGPINIIEKWVWSTGGATVKGENKYFRKTWAGATLSITNFSHGLAWDQTQPSKVRGTYHYQLWSYTTVNP